MKKILALAKYLGLEYFEFQGDYYTGASQIEIEEMTISEAEKFCEDEAILLSDQLTVSTYDDSIIEDGNKEYLVVTDDEADRLWDVNLDNYIEECILPEIPEAYQRYFDEEAFKNDASQDGRGHSLARYDGEENQEQVGGTIYFIYRQN